MRVCRLDGDGEKFIASIYWHESVVAAAVATLFLICILHAILQLQARPGVSVGGFWGCGCEKWLANQSLWCELFHEIGAWLTFELSHKMFNVLHAAYKSYLGVGWGCCCCSSTWTTANSSGDEWSSCCTGPCGSFSDSSSEEEVADDAVCSAETPAAA